MGADQAKKKALRRGPIRDTLESFGIAILAAVLLKYFALEAYVIPTSSMQPTLMGSAEASVYDRILVDKIRYEFMHPSRWDIVVFRYPLQKNQSYVKRCVGLPRDVLSIGGGNLYRVTGSGDQQIFEVLRKPDRIQRGLWKEVYPLRKLVRAGEKALGDFWAANPPRSWSEAGDTLTVELAAGRTTQLIYRDEMDGGLVNRVFDGYPVAIARAHRSAPSGRDQRVLEIVPDARLEARLSPEGSVKKCTLEIDVRRPARDRLVYALEVADGQARLLVRIGTNRTEAAASPAFPFPLDGTVTVAFERRDDELRAYRDGDEVQRLDVQAFHTREGCEILGAPDPTNGPKATASITLEGMGKTRIDDLRLSRDLHYTSRPYPQAAELIRVPEGHYFMMGDNTLQSVDSRGWTAVKVGVMPDGTLVPPTEANVQQGARIVKGNKRPMPVDKPPDRDETPVAIPSHNAVVMIDEFGEILALKASVGPSWGDDVLFQPVGSTDGNFDWKPPEEWVPFVPRGDIQGRALMVFWPFPPFSWILAPNAGNRAGFPR